MHRTTHRLQDSAARLIAIASLCACVWVSQVNLALLNTHDLTHVYTRVVVSYVHTCYV